MFMDKEDLREALQKTWYRATEEETGAEKVYRPVPPDGQIPMGRGREVFTLNPDGTLIYGGIAATDARTEAEGTWKVDDDNLVFYTKSASEPSRVMKIASVEKDRLVVKK
jgi:hypothetical protein